MNRGGIDAEDDLILRAGRGDAQAVRELVGGKLPRVLNLESEYVAATSAAQLSWLRSVITDLRAGRLAWSERELLGMALGDAQVAQQGQ